jgi:hypothetical protein
VRGGGREAVTGGAGARARRSRGREGEKIKRDRMEREWSRLS